jgi:hypothetical protein
MSNRNDKYPASHELDLTAVMQRAERIRSQQRKTDISAAASATQTTTDEGTVATSLRELNENITWLRRSVNATRQVLSGLYEHVGAPVWRVVRPPLLFIVRLYRAIWRRCAYVRHPSTGEPVISRARSSIIIVGTITFLALFTDTRLGEAVRFVTVEPVVDGVLMAVSLRTETFYLTQSDEIDPQGNIHSVRGCRRLGECSEVDAAYFRVAPRLAHDVWKLIVHGNPLYVPDHAVSPIAPGVNQCQVTYYGYRMTSSWIARILRSLQVYPTMLEASCVHLGLQSS